MWLLKPNRLKNKKKEPSFKIERCKAQHGS